MLHWMLVQRGRSLDNLEWTEWFDRTFEDVQMKVYVSEYEGMGSEYNKVKVELCRLGVPIVRSLLHVIDPYTGDAFAGFATFRLADAIEWLMEAFHIEYNMKSALVMSSAVALGQKYLNTEAFTEAQQWHFQQSQKVAIAEAYRAENTTGVPDFSPDRYSSFERVIDTLNFDRPIGD